MVSASLRWPRRDRPPLPMARMPLAGGLHWRFLACPGSRMTLGVGKVDEDPPPPPSEADVALAPPAAAEVGATPYGEGAPPHPNNSNAPQHLNRPAARPPYPGGRTGYQERTGGAPVARCTSHPFKMQRWPCPSLLHS
jgi:hypothetical protein